MRRGKFVTLAGGGEKVTFRHFTRNRLLMFAKMHEWLQLNRHVLMIRKQSVIDVNRVLSVQQKNLFFNDDAVNFVAPNRQKIFQPEFFQIWTCREIFSMWHFD